MPKQRLTDRQFISGVTLSDLLHFVVTGDTSQNPAGSSYKGSVEQLFSSFSSFTCTFPLIVDTVNSCSGAITINGDVTINGSATTINTQIIQSQDNNIVLNYSGTHLTAIGGGITVEDGQSDGVDSTILTDSNGYWLFNPGLSASTGTINNFTANTISVDVISGTTGTIDNFTANTISVNTIGSTGDCVTDIYVSNIHSCSPLNINSLDEGNVYFGSSSGFTVDLLNNRIGIGNSSPSETLDVNGKTKTTNFQMTSGATNGYVFTSDGSGNGSWQPSYVFTGNTSASCINDIFVSNIHSCSPLNINPLDEGNIYFGSNSGFTVDLGNGGSVYTKGEYVIQSEIDANSIIPLLEIGNNKGFVQLLDYTGNTGIFTINNSTSGLTGVVVGTGGVGENGLIRYHGSNYLRDTMVAVNGIDFYQNKMLISGGLNSNGLIIAGTPSSNDSRIWFEQNGNSPMMIAGGGTPNDLRLGIALNPNGTEIPTAQLQIGGTGTTGTFKYVDGNQQYGYILTSDVNGNATWQTPTVSADTNFANTDLTFNGNREHDTNGNYFQITTDSAGFNEGWFIVDPNYVNLGYDSTSLYADATNYNITVSGITRIRNLTSETVINDSGRNIDFRVEGDSDTHLLFVDASADEVAIGTNNPLGKLHIQTTENIPVVVVDGLRGTVLLGKWQHYTAQADTTTTSTNTSNIITIPMVNGDKITLTGKITALGTGTLTVGGTFTSVGYCHSGTVTIVDTVDTTIKENSAGSPSFTVVGSGSNIVVQVTGGGENLTWLCTYEYQIIAAPVS